MACSARALRPLVAMTLNDIGAEKESLREEDFCPRRIRNGEIDYRSRGANKCFEATAGKRGDNSLPSEFVDSLEPTEVPFSDFGRQVAIYLSVAKFVLRRAAVPKVARIKLVRFY